MNYYNKYLKYKNKYLSLRGGHKYNENIIAINSYFKNKNICTKDDLHIDDSEKEEDEYDEDEYDFKYES